MEEDTSKNWFRRAYWVGLELQDKFRLKMRKPIDCEHFIMRLTMQAYLQGAADHAKQVAKSPDEIPEVEKIRRLFTQ